MIDSAIEEALRQTLLDYRLTRSEKRSLKEVIAPFADDPHKLALARNCAFQLAKNEMQEARQTDVVSWLEDVVKVLQHAAPDPTGTAASQAFFSPQDPCVHKIVRMFGSARKGVDVCVYTITDDRIRDAILAAHRRGVMVRIISDNEKSDDLGSDIQQLDRRGVAVRVDRTEHHMHHKYAIFDNKQLITGSYNWTRSAAKNNEENFIVTSDPDLLKSFSRAFNRLWKQLGSTE